MIKSHTGMKSFAINQLSNCDACITHLNILKSLRLFSSMDEFGNLIYLITLVLGKRETSSASIRQLRKPEVLC